MVNNKIDQQLREAELYTKSNHLSRAKERYESCLAELRKRHQNENSTKVENVELAYKEAVVLNSMAIACFKLNELEKTLECFHKSYKLKEKVLEMQKEQKLDGKYVESCDLAAPLYNMARVYHYNNQLKEALKFYKAALNSRKKNVEEGQQSSSLSSNVKDEQLIPIYLQMGVLFAQQKTYNYAEKYLMEAFNIGKSTFGENDPAMANLLTHLGKVQYSMRKYKDALKKYSDALEICNNAGMTGPVPQVLVKLVDQARAKVDYGSDSSGKSKAATTRTASSTPPQDSPVEVSAHESLRKYTLFLSDMFADESSRLDALLIMQSFNNKKFVSFLEFDAALMKQNADQLGVLGSKSSLNISILIATLVKLYHDLTVVHRNHLKYMESSLRNVFTVQMELFMRNESKLKYYQHENNDSINFPSQVTEKRPALSTVAKILAENYYDFYKILQSPSNSFDSADASVDKVVNCIRSILKSHASKLKKEIRAIDQSSLNHSQQIRSNASVKSSKSNKSYRSSNQSLLPTNSSMVYQNGMEGFSISE